MKKYYVQFGEFGNVYTLRYAETKEEQQILQEQGYERITLKEAINLAKREKERRQYEPNMSGYADILIYPANYKNYIRGYKERKGYIVIR